MQVRRTSQYLPDMGVFEDDTKNRTSNRIIKIPQTAVNDLKQYRKHQLEMRLKVGDRWQETDRIFTTEFGAPLHPDTLSSWFSSFVKAHSDALPPISLHSLRHTNATMMIAGGVPITTVSNASVMLIRPPQAEYTHTRFGQPMKPPPKHLIIFLHRH